MLKQSLKILLGAIFCAFPLMAQPLPTTHITLFPVEAHQRIPAEIYGQFAEHIGTGIYGGIWVGPDSNIPNVQGYRRDVLQALQALHISVLRWPGGCFADNYHWQDGIGPTHIRPKIINTSWGGTVEDNSFGTHEFLNLCELLGCEPYISANVGSGTVEEMAKWIEYMTCEDTTSLTMLRCQNGRSKPWKVKYVGIGNESWGCGGQMTPEYYSNLFRRYGEYARNYGTNQLLRVASGASDYDYQWTKTCMQQIGSRMQALSLHYYTVRTWEGSKGSATQFSEADYYWTLQKCLGIEPVIQRHCAIMDTYDPQKKIQLFVDEWGTWWDEEPGTTAGHLYQQNTMRDAMVAALSFPIFHRYVDRIGMTNIAQTVNVLQAMVLTKGEQMILTPTYFVFQQYAVHQNALYVPLQISTDTLAYATDTLVALPAVTGTASLSKDKTLHLSLVNTDIHNARTVTIALQRSFSTCVGTILCAPYDAKNTFETPFSVCPTSFSQFLLENEMLVLTLPPVSIVTLALQ